MDQRVSSSRKPAIRLNALSLYILYRLYLDYVNDVVDPIDIEHICSSYLTNPSRNLVKTAIDRYRGSAYKKPNFIARSGNVSNGYRYSITAEGIEAVEEALKIEDSLMRHLAQEGEAALLAGYTVDPYAPAEEEFEEAYSQPDDWSEIELSDTELLTGAVDAIQELVVEIRVSNTFSAEFPGQVTAITETLESGVDKLRAGKPSRMQLFLLLQKPIAWIAEKFLGTALGEIAKKAANAVSKLIGL